MDLSLFTDQTVDIRLKNQTVYENVKLAYTRDTGYTLNPAPSGSRAVYSSKGTDLNALVKNSLDIEDIQLSRINLNDYVGFDVDITLRNWEKHQCIPLQHQKNRSSCFTFKSVLKGSPSCFTWTEKGKWFTKGEHTNDIIHIQRSKPQPSVMNRPEILSAIAEAKKQLTVLEEQLAQSPLTLQEAVVGNVLADGSEVVYKWPNGALLAAPAEFNWTAPCNPDFEDYLNCLGNKLNRWDWFIPTAELLNLAFGSLNLHSLNRVPHWTSSKKLWGWYSSDNAGRIRAFRYVTY